jgi:ribosomal protein S6
MSKKDRLRAMSGMVFRSGQLVPSESLVKRVEKVISNKSGVIDKLVGTWKKDMRKEIKKQGLSYLTDFNIEAQLKENMATIESNHMLKQLALSIALTEDDVKEAMIRTLAEMKSELKV